MERNRENRFSEFEGKARGEGVSHRCFYPRAAEPDAPRAARELPCPTGCRLRGVRQVYPRQIDPASPHQQQRQQ